MEQINGSNVFPEKLTCNQEWCLQSYCSKHIMMQQGQESLPVFPSTNFPSLSNKQQKGETLFQQTCHGSKLCPFSVCNTLILIFSLSGLVLDNNYALMKKNTCDRLNLPHGLLDFSSMFFNDTIQQTRIKKPTELVRVAP